MGFFSDLLGKSGAKDLQKSEAQRSAALTAGKTAARQEIGGGFDQAFGYLSPFADNGASFGMYKDAIGAGGAAGYQRAFDNFNADPFRAGETAAADNALAAIFKKYNAGGMGNSGASRLAVSRGAQERYGQQVADYRQRLAGLGQTGLDVAQAQSALATDRGNTLGNLEYGFGQQQANAATSYGNAMAQNRMTGPNNLLNLFGTAANAASLFIRPKTQPTA